ncbi:MAG: hypothetical protein ACRD6U_00310 [Nitrososphaeraceae archaeon]
MNINFISLSAENNVLKLSTDKDTYSKGETVNITLQNIGNNTVTFPTGGIIDLKNSDTGQCIWGCPDEYVTQALIDLEPGQIKISNWDQRDRNGTQVSPGKYTAYVFTNASTTFTITNGSSTGIDSVKRTNSDL